MKRTSPEHSYRRFFALTTTLVSTAKLAFVQYSGRNFVPVFDLEVVLQRMCYAFVGASPSMINTGEREASGREHSLAS